MERAALPRRLTWQTATVAQLVAENAHTTSLVLEIPDWPGHRAGQHVDVRLTADDGYQAQRSYSIASAPEDTYIVLTVERLDDGEVSPYLTQQLQTGDALELRGPIGDYFAWQDDRAGPVQLIGGGSGIAPLRAMLRHHQATRSNVPLRLLYSTRSLPDAIYRDELTRLTHDGLDIRLTLTRQQPTGWTGYARRIDAPLLAETTHPSNEHPLIYICGPNTFVETAANTLVELGHNPSLIRTERFGPTGG